MDGDGSAESHHLVLSAAITVRDDRCDKRGPTRLVRGAKPRAGIAVEILIEEGAVAPCGVALKERVRAVHGSTPLTVGKEEPQEAPLDFIRHGAEMGAPARARRHFDREVVSQATMEGSQRLNGKIV